jgi:hypothetical protein
MAAEKIASSPVEIYARPEFDVVISSVVLEDYPARLHYVAEVAGMRFNSSMTYRSISSWSTVWEPLSHVTRIGELLGTLVAWDAMRFLALGGERMVLPEGLRCAEVTRALWSACFLNQFGEWRFRNRIGYRDSSGPVLETRHGSLDSILPAVDCGIGDRDCTRAHLLANGGGKDTLAGMLLLKRAGLPYDIYEGYLPVGGCTKLQEQLLRRLRDAAGARQANVVQVSVEDDFFSRPEGDFKAAGVATRFYKTDFAVGHTANYPGYFPLVLAHRYKCVWFNIERSADDSSLDWMGTGINHQWCKSAAYQSLATELFRQVTGCTFFKGFDSTLRGLYDLSIYRIVATRPDLLRETHSCNYGKPWCQRCPKCCFCYLMTAAYHGEEFALKMVGADTSLFILQENLAVWRDLLDPTRVAWECVPSHQECLVAVDACLRSGIEHPVLRHYSPSPVDAEAYRNRYSEVNWNDVPHPLMQAVRSFLSTGLVCETV